MIIGPGFKTRDWRRWFAWRPVYIGHENYAWLGVIERRTVWGPGSDATLKEEYRIIEK